MRKVLHRAEEKYYNNSSEKSETRNFVIFYSTDIQSFVIMISDLRMTEPRQKQNSAQFNTSQTDMNLVSYDKEITLRDAP